VLINGELARLSWPEWLGGLPTLSIQVLAVSSVDYLCWS